MHDYAYSAESVRLAIIIGVVIAAVFYERIQLTSGGMIVPAYLAVFLPDPINIVITVGTAFATFYIVNRLLVRRWILYGRRLYELEILVSLALIGILLALAHEIEILSHIRMPAMQGVGYIIPAILAHDMNRQGWKKTLTAVGANTLILGAVIYVIASLLGIAPNFTDPVVQRAAIETLGYPRSLLLPGLFASVIAGMLVFRAFHLRTGGFITGAYVAFFLTKPADLIFALVASVLTYYLVTEVISRQILMFGRRKLSMMILAGGMITWAMELGFTAATQGQWVPWNGFQVMTLMIPALIANDAQRQGLYRTFWGSGLTAVFVFASMNLLAAGLVTLNILA